MRVLLPVVLALGWVGPALAGPFFIDHRGEKVALEPVPDRIAVRLAPGALEQVARWPEIQAGPPVARRGALTELALGTRFRGRAEQVIRRLLESGLAERAGAVFYEPGGRRTVALDRQVLVKLRDPASAGNWAAANGLRVVDRLGLRDDLLVVETRDAAGALETAVELAHRREVLWAIPDFVVPVELFHRPADPFYAEQWHHDQANGAHIGSEKAWDVTLGDPRVVVAVIDTGVQENHPDFDPGRLVTGYNSVDGSNDPTPLTTSVDAHGTCCAGSIAASIDNGEGIAGICPHCSLMGIKMMDGQTTQTQLSNGYRALEYATDQGAWVISNSWGNIPENMLAPYYDAVRDAVSNGRGGAGTVVLFASGNGDPPWSSEARPIGSAELQNMPEVMTVGGTGPDDRTVIYSNYGSNLSVVAPTGELDPTSYENPFDGPQIFTTDTFGNNGGFSRDGFYWQMGLWGQEQRWDVEEPDGGGNYTAHFNGTSAACPIAAGVVALALSANPNLDGAEVRSLVEQTADKVGGVVYDADGHEDHYGYGRVSAARAVRAAPYGLDNPDGVACVEDVNCDGGICARADPDDTEGFCAQPCASDADCEPGQTCAPFGSGGPDVCIDSCSEHAECPEGTLCVDQSCTRVACTDGTACPAGTACPVTGDDRACRPVCSGDQECEPPALCLPAGGGDLCQAIACSDGSECPAGTACPVGGGTCQRSCTSDIDCTQPALCLPAGGGDLCQAIACSDGSECPADTACPDDGGHCVRSCTSDADCVPPEKCLPAGNGRLCQTIPCLADQDCPDDMECGTGGICVPATGECTSDEDCEGGWRCVNGYCYDPGPDGDGDGGGGCGCGGDVPQEAGLWAVVLLLGWMRRRR